MARLLQPGLDRRGPRLRIPDGIGGRQAHAVHHAVGHGCLVGRRPHHGLVATGGEVAQGVTVTLLVQQHPQVHLVLSVDQPLVATRAEQREPESHVDERSQRSQQERDGS